MTPGVTPEQARAMHAKLWQMHVDSQRTGGSSTPIMSNSGDSTELKHGQSQTGSKRSSSRPVDPSAARVPFKDRIRSGMVVSWSEVPSRPNANTSADLNLAIVLCPADSNTCNGAEVPKTAVNPQSAERAKTGPRKSRSQYLCARVVPGSSAGAYEVSLWEQVILDVDMMQKEVILEYDAGTRYYYISV